MIRNRKKKKSLLRRLNAWLHLWLGIVSGIILVVVAFTGTLIVYGDEIIDWSAGSARYVNAIGASRLPLEQIMQHIGDELPEYHLSEVVMYDDPKRSLRFRCFSEADGLSMIYADPYTGAILKVDGTANFFYIVAHIHAAFLWHGPGFWIVDIATVIFLVGLITGIILWWPKKWNKHSVDASFKIRWRARWKRVNYDLHNVLGFYSSVLALILTVTGLLIAFHGIKDQAIELLGGNPDHRWEESLPTSDSTLASVPLGKALTRALADNPEARLAQMWVYRLAETGYYRITTATRVGLKSAENARISYVDRYSGQTIVPPESTLQAEYLENYLWQLHMGTWMGPVGKFFTFLCGLICTSLPITGFIVWIGKKKKKKKKKVPARRRQAQLAEA